MMVLDSPLVFTLLDMFFGGDGSRPVKAEGRDYSAVEQRMVRRVVESALEDLQMAWRSVFPLQITFLRSEVNPQFVAIVPPTDVAILATFSVEMGREPLYLSICWPYAVLEPLHTLLQSGTQTPYMRNDGRWGRYLQRNLSGREQPLVARVTGRSITLSQLLGLRKGQVLMTGHTADPALELSIGGAGKFSGVLSSQRVRRAVRIDGALDAPADDELAALQRQARELEAKAREEAGR